jgi:hypothetical protein
MNTRQCVRIKVRGQLSDRLATIFEGMTLVHRADGSELVGEIADQAQLHGILSRIRDLGLELESVMTDRQDDAACRRGQARVTASARRERP